MRSKHESTSEPWSWSVCLKKAITKKSSVIIQVKTPSVCVKQPIVKSLWIFEIATTQKDVMNLTTSEDNNRAPLQRMVLNIIWKRDDCETGQNYTSITFSFREKKTFLYLETWNTSWPTEHLTLWAFSISYFSSSSFTLNSLVLPLS